MNAAHDELFIMLFNGLDYAKTRNVICFRGYIYSHFYDGFNSQTLKTNTSLTCWRLLISAFVLVTNLKSIMI